MYELKILSIKYLHTQSFDISQRQSMLYINSTRVQCVGASKHDNLQAKLNSSKPFFEF